MAIEIRGLDSCLDSLGAFVNTFPQKVAKAARTELEIEMTEAKKRTPVLTGALRGSGHVVGPEQDGADMVIRMVFGGPSAPYALFVHENLEAFHPVGQAKFLESTLNESAPYLAGRIEQRVWADIGSSLRESRGDE